MRYHIHYSEWIKQRKLHMIWRAIARRHLSRLAHAHVWSHHESDGESDP